LRIVAFLAAAAIAAPAAAQPAASAQGANLFKQRCAMCHATAPGVKSTMGPNLAGVAGRASGAAKDYAYSKALAGGKIRWDAAALDAFLAAPAKKAPGTKMMIGVPNAADRKAIVAYVGTLKGS
jgi:cytochrome c